VLLLKRPPAFAAGNMSATTVVDKCIRGSCGVKHPTEKGEKGRPARRRELPGVMENLGVSCICSVFVRSDAGSVSAVLANARLVGTRQVLDVPQAVLANESGDDDSAEPPRIRR